MELMPRPTRQENSTETTGMTPASLIGIAQNANASYEIPDNAASILHNLPEVRVLTFYSSIMLEMLQDQIYDYKKWRTCESSTFSIFNTI